MTGPTWGRSRESGKTVSPGLDDREAGGKRRGFLVFLPPADASLEAGAPELRSVEFRELLTLDGFGAPGTDYINYDELIQMKLLSRLFPRKPVPRTEEEIAALIEGFANGTGGRWDWDYFISTDFENERINWAKKECFKVEEEFPRTGRVGWCNERGLDRLRAIASELRTGARNS